MSAVTLAHCLTSMRLPLGAFWPLGQTRCCRRGSSLLRTSLQVDGTVMLAEGCHPRSATVTQSLFCSVSVQCACHCRKDLLRPCGRPPPAGGHAHCSRSVCPAMSFMPPMVTLTHILPMPPMWRTWCQCSPCRCTNRCRFIARQTQSLLRRSSHARTRFAGCVHRSAHGGCQLGVASVVRSGRVGRHALFHCAGAQIAADSPP